MNENLNLVEILKDCPKGWKFYSTIYGEVGFEKIREDSKFPIVLITKYGNNCDIRLDGRYYGEYYDGECTLFPSKDQRDWSKFTAPWYKKDKLVELKESDNEKIRRWIIDDIRYNMNNEPLNNSEYKKKAEKAIAWLENQGEQNLPSANERAWTYLVSDVLTWKDGIGQYLDDTRVQELAKRLCSEYSQKLYNPSAIEDKKPKNKVTEPSYRPFKNKDECWHEMQKHSPFGWLYHKVCNCYVPIRVSIEDDTNFKNFFNLYTFADGTPFGILEN